jgi:RNA polymerase sigma-54 factor
MALETKLYQRLSQQLVMTPQLRQAIKILQVSRAELEQLVEQELEENCVLEEDMDLRGEVEPEEAPRTEEQPETPSEATDDWDETRIERETTNELAPDKGLKEIDWKEYLDNYSNDWHNASATSTSTPAAAGSAGARRPAWSAPAWGQPTASP